MILLIAISAALSPVQDTRAVPATQARASVRIVSSARLRVGAVKTEEGKSIALKTIRSRDQTRQLAWLAEFE